MLRAKVKGLSVSTIALFVALFKPEGIPSLIRYGIQIGMLSIYILYSMTRKERLHKNAVIYIIIPICISSIYSHADGVITLEKLFTCFYYMFCLWSICQLFQTWIIKGRYNQLLNLLLDICGVYCVLSVISVFYEGTINSSTTTYLFGGKFITTYYFILYLGLSYAKNQSAIEKREWDSIVFAVKCALVFAFEAYLNCSTGLLIVLVLFLLVALPYRFRVFLTRRGFFIVTIIASGLIPLLIEGILSNNVVQLFIVNILGKTLTLTGRLPIYRIYLLPLIRQRFYLGYGFNSSIMFLRTGVYWNAQNGLFDVILNYGIIGAIGLLVTCFKAGGNKNAQTIGWPFYVVLYPLILAATIEVSYEMVFLFAISLLYITQFVE